MDEKIAAALRKAFPPEQIGQLPRGGVTLDYVGHADVTSRLLEADPEWNWEPVATDEHGLPVLDTDDRGNPVGLWIKLTAGGVTRLGYGSCPSNQNDAVKVLIGDALRNAAMRFGVALDLWAKGDRANPAAENATASAGHAARRQRPQQRQRRPEPVPDPDPDDPWMARIEEISSQEEADKVDEELKAEFRAERIDATRAHRLHQAVLAKAALLAKVPE